MSPSRLLPSQYATCSHPSCPTLQGCGWGSGQTLKNRCQAQGVASEEQLPPDTEALLRHNLGTGVPHGSLGVTTEVGVKANQVFLGSTRLFKAARKTVCRLQGGSDTDSPPIPGSTGCPARAGRAARSRSVHSRVPPEVRFYCVTHRTLV